MQLHHWKDVEQMHADHTFRTPVWGVLILPVILLVCCIALVWALVTAHLPAFFWISVVLIAPFVPLILYTNFLPSLRPTNWVLKVRGDTVYLMLRNFREGHSPEDSPVVVSFDFGEIASVGKLSKKISTPSSNGGDTTWTQHSLEIRLRASAPQAFVDALNAERTRRPPAVGFVRKKSYYRSPVTRADSRTIRILWRGRYEVVKPGINAAVETLTRYVDQHAAEVIDRTNPEHLSDSAFDDLVLALCESGAKIDAIRLLKRHRGYSTASAKAFVDELTESPVA